LEKDPLSYVKRKDQRKAPTFAGVMYHSPPLKEVSSPKSLKEFDKGRRGLPSMQGQMWTAGHRLESPHASRFWEKTPRKAKKKKGKRILPQKSLKKEEKREMFCAK